jgi:hypothetical protein
MGILFKHFKLHKELNMTEDDTKNQTNRGISETGQVWFPHHFSRSYKVDVRMDLHKDLQDEIDALVELGQEGVHTVTRSQAFKDTGWDPTEGLGSGGCQGNVVWVESTFFEESLTYKIESSEIVLKKSPEGELEILRQFIESRMESEAPLPYHTELLTSSEGQECGLFTEFYLGVWNTIGTVDDCRWIVFSDLEELDLFLLKEDSIRYINAPHSLNEELLRKWNEDNREFWNKIYEFQVRRNKWVEDR